MASEPPETIAYNSASALDSAIVFWFLEYVLTACPPTLTCLPSPAPIPRILSPALLSPRPLSPQGSRQ